MSSLIGVRSPGQGGLKGRRQRVFFSVFKLRSAAVLVRSNGLTTGGLRRYAIGMQVDPCCARDGRAPTDFGNTPEFQGWMRRKKTLALAGLMGFVYWSEPPEPVTVIQLVPRPEPGVLVWVWSSQPV